MRYKWLPLPLLLLFVFCLEVAVGPVKLSLPQVIAALLGSSEPKYVLIVRELRLPRALLATITGMALATSGAVFQAVFRNPLAEPYVLGVASGAALGMTLSLLYFKSHLFLLSFVSALLTLLVVYLIARISRGNEVMSLLLAGISISLLFSSATSFLMYLNSKDATTIIFTIMGTLSNASWERIRISYFEIPVIVAIYVFFRELNIMVLGDENAKSLGVDVEKVRIVLLFLATLLASISVALCGIIGFVGLITPHIARILSGGNYRVLIPAASMLGAILLTLADLSARIVIAPSENSNKYNYHIFRCSLFHIPTPHLQQGCGKVISIRNLEVWYSACRVLQSISTDFKEGIVAILGPNGSGKTTLLRALMKIVSFSGRIEINDEDLKKMSRKEIARKISFVPQEFPEDVEFTALEIVIMGRYPHKKFFSFDDTEDYRISRDALNLVKLDKLAERSLRSMSSGEKQRVLIARALAQKADILLLDEPTSNLDLKHSIEVMRLLKKLAQRKAVVLTMHNINLASLYCDRIILLKEGKIVADGSPEQVITPDNIKEVYGCEVAVVSHPANGKPQVVLLP